MVNIVPPKIGEFGVTKVETLYYNDGLGKMSKILYKNKSDGQLDYTVIPKYNKEGDVVKRDTIRNE